VKQQALLQGSIRHVRCPGIAAVAVFHYLIMLWA
jgi:hypothetical protein